MDAFPSRLTTSALRAVNRNNAILLESGSGKEKCPEESREFFHSVDMMEDEEFSEHFRMSKGLLQLQLFIL